MLGRKKRVSWFVEQLVEVDPLVQVSEPLGSLVLAHDRYLKLPSSEHAHRFFWFGLEHP
jgi:hypothetical protein